MGLKKSVFGVAPLIIICNKTLRIFYSHLGTFKPTGLEVLAPKEDMLPLEDTMEA